MKRNWYKEAIELAEYVSSFSPLYDYKVNRRNGYVALDYYSKDGRMLDYIECGTSKEVYLVLRGMRHIIWQHTNKPF